MARSQLVLCCDKVPLPEIAKKYGTPLYVYSASGIRQRLRTFDHAFRGVPHTVCYSVKANSNLSILRLLGKSGCGFDVVSGGELERVLAVDRAYAARVVFSGVGKTADELRLALKHGILLFNVESESELSRLAEFAQQLNRTATIALRVNPDVHVRTHPYISTGLHEHKFGIPIADARKLYAGVRKVRHLKVAGVSLHIGSQITSPEPFAAAISKAAELIRQLRGDGHRIPYLDAGGGLGVPYENSDAEDFREYAQKYADAIIGELRGLKVHLLLEPGRVIVAPAGALLTSVLYRKQNDGRRFLVVDAGMTELLRPALYGAYHEIAPVRPRHNSPASKFDVVGPVCESGDFFARNRELPECSEVDLLAILDAGAYGMVLSSNYNTRPRAAEVLVDGHSVRLIRRRESVADLIAHELPL
ncbi:MAG TPA: diaminopimelate decarboxylase [Terriglobales bacterium]|nr:diaminopimelate decarboxylase [Terriglobales bacterium]